MSVSDIDLRKVGKVLILGLVVYGLAVAAAWGLGGDIMAALRQGIGIAVAWAVGNLADCGMVMPNMESLRK